MKTYNILVKETLERIIEIKASNIQDAIEEVETMYNNEDIVLDASDFQGVDIVEYNENL